MKNIFITIFFVSTMFFIGGCKQLDNVRKQENKRWEKQQERARISGRKRIAKNIKYIKDQRTGYCFAYYGTSHMYGESFALAHVHCDKIPAELLK